MSKWKETNLSDICSDISYGYTASAIAEQNGPKFLRITDIVPDRINWETVPYCPIAGKDLEKYKLQNGDIVIARTGATTGYNKTIKNINFDAVFASYLIRYKIDRSKADPYYVGQILQSSNWYDYVGAIAGGSAQPGANAKQLGSFEILLPPLSEQRAIASVLSSLDDKIDLLHRQNKTLEAMAETLFRQWFVEEADEGWEEGKLGDVADFNNGKSRPESIEGSTIPIYGGNGILGYTTRSNSEGMSIVIGRVGAYCGSLYIENRPIWITDNALSAKPKDKKYTSYLYYLLKSLNLNQMAEGSSHPLLTQTLLNTIDITIPSDDIITAFWDFADSILMKSFFNKHQICTINKLRDILLPKLMSGEVRVSL